MTGFHNCRSLPNEIAELLRGHRTRREAKLVEFLLDVGPVENLAQVDAHFCTIEDGVPGGATRTNHPDAANPCTVSDTVARSGRDAKRAGDATASNLTCPPARGPARPSMIIGTRPLITSLMACALPG